MTKLQLTLYDGAPFKEILVTIVKAIKGGKMESSIDGSVLTFLVSTSGFKFYTPQGMTDFHGFLYFFVTVLISLPLSWAGQT